MFKSHKTYTIAVAWNITKCITIIARSLFIDTKKKMRGIFENLRKFIMTFVSVMNERQIWKSTQKVEKLIKSTNKENYKPK